MSYEQAWLSYKVNEKYIDRSFLSSVYTTISGIVMENTINELKLVTEKIFNKEICTNKDQGNSSLILRAVKADDLGEEGYHITTEKHQLIIEGQTIIAIMYGVFHIIRLVSANKKISGLSINEKPSNPVRMLNHWDNMSGDIERGYSGQSFFFNKGEILVNRRIKDYARLISSIGINSVSINNVNVYDAQELITEKHLSKVREISDIFSGYGIKLFLSISFAAPMVIGGLDTADPCSSEVIEWWENRADTVYSAVPSLGGFVVKADSEGRPGPFSYNRTHAEGANMLANAVTKYNGTIIWRCFVYNCKQDWRDRKTDRARAGYDNFMPIDGTFKDNVILQIKNGPMDFQVREPVSPLFGGLKKTNQLLEVQIAQEYTGQQRHVCYLIPLFKKILEFKTYYGGGSDTVADIASGKTFDRNKCGFVAVTNTGNDENWTGHDLAAANLYGFGRLAWNTDLSAEEISREWILLTFSDDKRVMDVIGNILMKSWPTYEKYTSPLGIGWMVNPNHHYGPNVDGYEYDRWGTYHRADHNGIGVDRTSKGTGYIDQYYKENVEMYENVETCPEELLLFFHYIRYDYQLKTGKTLIQHIYDSHFDGAEDVEQFKRSWMSIKNLINSKVYDRVLARLEHQVIHSRDWRDIVNTYFYRKSMIEDSKGRVIY